jgi:phospholipase/carboxylesterase
MSEFELDAVEIETTRPVHASIIWLHGLGADGHDFEPIVPYLGLPPGAAVRFVFPHAPQRPVTLNGGLRMRAWYDLYGLDLLRREDAEGIRDSSRLIAALIEREIERGIPGERIVLAGFSQGGAMALFTGLRQPNRLAGLLALSCYLPLADTLLDERQDVNRETPILMMHGRHDDIVPIRAGQASRELLAALGHPVEWHDYPMAHEVNPEQIRAIGDWLGVRLGLSSGA